ncbi:MAG: response regulator [Gemmatimonadetes bacterium]|nr:response regulator [Gemmatimonadota bacterium]
MSARRSASIRTLTATAVALLVVPLLGIGGWVSLRLYQAEQKAAEDRLAALADAAAAGISEFLDGTRRLLDGLAADPRFVALEPSTCAPLLEDLRGILSPVYATLGTLRPDGTLACSLVPILQGADTAGSPSATQPLSVGTYVLTPVHRGAQSGRWVAAMTRPLVGADGGVVGKIYLSVDLVRFQEILSRMNIPEGALVSVVQSDITVVARSRGSDAWVGRRLPPPVPEVTDLPGSEPRGMSHGTAAEGDAVTWGFARIPGTDWTVYAGLPTEEILAPVRAGRVRLGLFGVLALVVASFLGYRIYRGFTEPLERLVAGIADARRGLPAVFPPNAPREIAWVAERFAQAWAARDEAERERAKADERMRLLVENSVTGMAVVAEDGRFLEANGAMADLLGYGGREELLAAPSGAGHPTPGTGGVPLPGPGGGREFRSVPMVWIRRDGAELNVRVSGRARALEGGVLAWDVVAEDVTDVTRLQAQAQQAHKMEALGRMAGGVAHDFNTLLPVLQVQAELLRMDPLLGPQHREELAEIEEATSRGAALNRQLLAFGRGVTEERTALRLNNVVQGFERVRRRAVGEEVRVALDLPEEVPPVLANRSQLEQVLMNLVVNARDAMPGGGVLRIGTAYRTVDAAEAQRHDGARPGSYAVLTVADSGTGIPEAILPRVFEPFFSTKAEVKGTGLGLATVYGIVSDSGGHVRISSTVGRGTAVAVYLPALTEPVPPARPRVDVTPLPAGRSGVVLLVEDEEGIRRLVARILERAGYRVVTAADGLEALSVVERLEGGIDLLLTDIVMPGMRGHELADQLARAGAVRRAVFFSGYPEGFNEQGLEVLDSWVFLAKPFTSVELLDALDQVLGTATV